MAVVKTFATHALSLVKRLGQRFESARRLYVFCNPSSAEHYIAATRIHRLLFM